MGLYVSGFKFKDVAGYEHGKNVSLNENVCYFNAVLLAVMESAELCMNGISSCQCGDPGWFQVEKLNQSVHCSQGFPQTVITSDYFQSVGFGFK